MTAFAVQDVIVALELMLSANIAAGCGERVPIFQVPTCAAVRRLHEGSQPPYSRAVILGLSGTAECLETWTNSCYEIEQLRTPHWENQDIVRFGWPPRPSDGARGWSEPTTRSFIDIHKYGTELYIVVMADVDIPACPRGSYSKPMTTL